MNEQELKEGIQYLVNDLKAEIKKENRSERVLKILHECELEAFTPRYKGSRDGLRAEFPGDEDLGNMYKEIDELVEEYHLSERGFDQ